MGGAIGGGMKNSTPNAPGSPDYQSDPSKFKAFNTTPQYNTAMSQIGQQTGQNQQNLQSRLSGMGAGRSAGAARGMQDIAAQGQQTAAGVGSNLAANSFQQQLGQMNAANQFGLGKYQSDIGSYQAQQQANQAEQARRNGLLQGVFGSTIGSLFGN